MPTPTPIAASAAAAENMSALLTMKDILQKYDLELPRVGSIVHGQIIGVSKSLITVDLGPLGTGVVYPGEFYDNTTLLKSLKVGQAVAAILLSYEDDGKSGFRELSLKRAQMTTAWDDIKNKKDSGEVISAPIVNINKGGLITEINGIQGFLPLSQLSPAHYPKVEGGDTTKIVQTLQKYRNQSFDVKIIDFSEAENRLIVSEKAISDQHIKEQLARFHVGDIVDGVITDVTDFGAFVWLNAEETATDAKTETEAEETAPAPEVSAAPGNRIEGLIHISEIDWKIIDNPRDILSSGQKIKAKIISVDGGKISLSLKQLKDDPWLQADQHYQVGQVVSGRVAKLTNYGALVSLEDSITGLISLSEFNNKRPSDVLKIGDSCQTTIISLDAKDHKMLLSLNK